MIFINQIFIAVERYDSESERDREVANSLQSIERNAMDYKLKSLMSKLKTKPHEDDNEAHGDVKYELWNPGSIMNSNMLGYPEEEEISDTQVRGMNRERSLQNPVPEAGDEWLRSHYLANGVEDEKYEFDDEDVERERDFSARAKKPGRSTVNKERSLDDPIPEDIIQMDGYQNVHDKGDKASKSRKRKIHAKKNIADPNEQNLENGDLVENDDIKHQEMKRKHGKSEGKESIREDDDGEDETQALKDLWDGFVEKIPQSNEASDEDPGFQDDDIFMDPINDEGSDEEESDFDFPVADRVVGESKGFSNLFKKQSLGGLKRSKSHSKKSKKIKGNNAGLESNSVKEEGLMGKEENKPDVSDDSKPIADAVKGKKKKKIAEKHNGNKGELEMKSADEIQGDEVKMPKEVFSNGKVHPHRHFNHISNDKEKDGDSAKMLRSEAVKQSKQREKSNSKEHDNDGQKPREKEGTLSLRPGNTAESEIGTTAKIQSDRVMHSKNDKGKHKLQPHRRFNHLENEEDQKDENELNVNSDAVREAKNDKKKKSKTQSETLNTNYSSSEKPHSHMEETRHSNASGIESSTSADVNAEAVKVPNKRKGILSDTFGENEDDLDMMADAVKEARRRKVPHVNHPSNRLDMNEVMLSPEEEAKLKEAQLDSSKKNAFKDHGSTEDSIKQKVIGENKNQSKIEDVSNESLSVTLLINTKRLLSDEDGVTKSIKNSTIEKKIGHEGTGIKVEMVDKEKETAILNEDSEKGNEKRDSHVEDTEEGK